MNLPDPHPEFTRALLDTYHRAQSEARYNSRPFFKMLQEDYGYDTALYLTHLPLPSSGFTKLWERQRLDLTVEAVVLRPEWYHLFSDADRMAAYRRLKQYHYEFPADSWRPEVVHAPPPLTPVANDADELPPDRVLTVTYRVLRDTEKARRVKELHTYRCQICDHTIRLPNGSLYAEAHHIKPLGRRHTGPDVMENILCVCPNHHAELDYGARRLSLSALRTVPGHRIGSSFIDYHNQQICVGAEV